MAWDKKQKFNLDSLADIQGDIRKHQEVLAEIKIEEDIVNQKVKTANEGLLAIEKQKADLELKIEELTKYLKEFIAFIPGLMVESLESLKKSNKILDKNIEVLKQLGLKIEQEKINLGVVQENAEQIHKQILEESRILSIRKSDLDIYQKRVEEAYAKVLPDEKIIV